MVQILLILSSVTSFYSGHAAEKTLSPQEARYVKNLILRCSEQGVGQACFEYSQILSEVDAVKNEKMAILYMRRACQLAYGPACSHKSAPKEVKLDNTADNQKCIETFTTSGGIEPIALPNGGHGFIVSKIEKGSPLDKAGAKVGDLITKVNNGDAKSIDDFKGALGNGPAAIEINRGGTNISLTASCK